MRSGALPGARPRLAVRTVGRRGRIAVLARKLDDARGRSDRSERLFLIEPVEESAQQPRCCKIGRLTVHGASPSAIILFKLLQVNLVPIPDSFNRIRITPGFY